MTSHRGEDDALEALLRVTDVRAEQAIEEGLRLDAGLAAILKTGVRASGQTLPPAKVDATASSATSAEAAESGDALQTPSLRRTAVMERRAVADDLRLSEEEIRLLAQIASGVTADVAARKLELSARTLRRRLRTICDRLEVNTPIEAVVWAARRQLI